MSRSAFSAKFTELVGQSTMQYATQWRMQLARQRLRPTTESVATIPAQLGYGSETAFSKAFKRTFGVTPGQARAARQHASSSSGR